MNAIRRFIDRRLGRGEAAITVPILDGPLMPNAALDEAGRFAQVPDADNLVATDQGLVCSAGAEVRRLDWVEGVATTLLDLPAPVSAMAGGKGMLAIGVDGQGVVIHGGQFDGHRFDGMAGVGPKHPTSLAFLDGTTLLATEGSEDNAAGNWRRDLMEKRRSGSLWRLDLASGKAARILGGLGWASGVAMTGSQRIWIAESWRHRILSVDLETGQSTPVLEHLPAYPARIAPAVNAGYWLSFYSVRNQLVEFILREDAYRGRMLAEVPEAYWMAPSLSSGNSFREPMQGSQLKQMGVLKPYAATRSYGLVVQCDPKMRAIRSFHSRADGAAHGCVSVCERGDALYVASRGAGRILRLDDVAREE
ncbi:hypothetical protein [Aquicoccus sp. SU-CL01552]|uniref:hypothetical protein n=1 Tax=Aquicoccus sp. SU-CL01552 TaxID=3127656 RepID=UPI0033416DB8